MEYKLYGFINHIGDIDFGHYYANIKIIGSWNEFNDSIVKSEQVALLKFSM